MMLDEEDPPWPFVFMVSRMDTRRKTCRLVGWAGRHRAAKDRGDRHTVGVMSTRGWHAQDVPTPARLIPKAENYLS